MEPFLGRHFVQEYFDLLLNPDSNVAFHDDWINDIQRLMQSSKSLKYSVLANAASHMHWIDGTPQMQELALSYYSRSVKDLSTTLASPSLPNNQFYATLMAIILLYLHGVGQLACNSVLSANIAQCMGRGTYGDIPFHLAAATKIIQLRFMNNPTVVLDRLFDRLAVESVMYQIFLVSTGLWTGDPTHANYRYDPHFWLQCEALLARSTLFPGQPAASNSPVLGVPCALFKLILSIKQLLSSPLLYDEDTVKHLKSEVAYWEAALTLQNEQAKRDRTICDDATLLYILIASLLCEQLSTSRELLFTGLPQPASSPSWQLQALAEILQRRHMDDEWGRCFVANWPVYTAGFFVTDLHHIGLVREDLSGRWARSNFAQVARYKNDLETTWTQRELVVDAVDDYTALGRLTLSK